MALCAYHNSQRFVSSHSVETNNTSHHRIAIDACVIASRQVPGLLCNGQTDVQLAMMRKRGAEGREWWTEAAMTPSYLAPSRLDNWRGGRSRVECRRVGECETVRACAWS